MKEGGGGSDRRKYISVLPRFREVYLRVARSKFRIMAAAGAYKSALRRTRRIHSSPYEEFGLGERVKRV